jgi:hypothetical protein
MITPFVFGKLADGKEFTNREKDIERLKNNFISGTNSILISPRRWGKSSLVHKTAGLISAKNSKIVFCHIDLYNVKDQSQFYRQLSQEVIRATATKFEERAEMARNFISRFIPKISWSPVPEADFSLGLDWKEVQKNPDQIIDLAESIAQKKRIRIIMCIDEFQNIREFDDEVSLQKKLRSHWQKHKNVSYCLYGSKRHMMMHVFNSPSMPFYKFGDLMMLEKISETHWIDFISKRFNATGKKITGENALLIAQSADCHPYYVQQLAQLSWLRTAKTCNEGNIKEALDSLLLQLSLLFQNLTDSLASTQVNYMMALLEGSENLSSAEMLRRYNLGTSANVLKIRNALINREIIDSNDKKLNFLDPMYKLWLKRYFFKIESAEISRK